MGIVVAIGSAACGAVLLLVIAVLRERRNRSPPTSPFAVAGLHADLYLKYRDADGHLTERRITLHAATGERRGGSARFTKMEGYCHLRRANRTFRLDRVAEAADADGVIIPDLNRWIEEMPHIEGAKKKSHAPAATSGRSSRKGASAAPPTRPTR